MGTEEADTLMEGMIATKLSPSDLDSRLVSREGLFIPYLQAGRRHAVLSIVAAAGSGKSTIMAQAHRTLVEQGECTGWLSLDADDNHCESFTLYFVAALAQIDPTFSQQEVEALRANPVRDYDAVFEGIIRSLSTLTRPTTLFLDDFQHITDERILAHLNKLIAWRPKPLRFVVASRVRPLLDLARLRASGELVELSQDELNFDQAQTAIFLKRFHGLELQASDLDALLETTEGWPTGVQLAALALRRHKGPASELINTFSGRDKDLTAYLAETVIRTQPELVRSFLLRTAPLRRMSPELCEATSGHPNSEEMLEHLERSNLFIIALDRDGRWYRYHHLFAEFLQNELRRTDPIEYRAVCDRAAEWCDKFGQTTEAIQYALDAERFEKAADLIARDILRVAQSDGDHYMVIDWLRRLPEAFHDRRPEIAIGHAWSRAFSRDSGRAIALTERLIKLLSQEGSDPWALSAAQRVHFTLSAKVTQAIALACADEIPECLTLSKELRDTLPDHESFLISSTCNVLGYIHFCKREFERCAEIAAEGYQHGRRADAAYATIWADFLHGLANVELGRLRAAEQIGTRALENARSANWSRSYRGGLASLLNADIAMQRCDFDKARSFMNESRAFVAIFGPVEPLLVALRNEARLHSWDGQIDLARKVLQQGQDAALGTRLPRLHLALAIEEASLQLVAGDLDGASHTARTAKLRSHFDEFKNHHVHRSLRDALSVLEARFLIAELNPTAAVRTLTTLQQSRTAETQGGMPQTVRALRAVALWQSGRHSEAARELDRALSAAASEFHSYPIASAGRALLPVLAAMSERRPDEGAIAELAAKTRLQRWLDSTLRGEAPQPASSAPTPGPDMIEGLTTRETELLGLVQAGLGNKDLAHTLLVSESTVKWHLHNIYEKMGVRSRSAAVARAREKRLI